MAQQTWTDSDLKGISAKKQHLDELKSAINSWRTAYGLSTTSFTNRIVGDLVVNNDTIITEMKNALNAIHILSGQTAYSNWPTNDVQGSDIISSNLDTIRSNTNDIQANHCYQCDLCNAQGCSSCNAQCSPQTCTTCNSTCYGYGTTCTCNGGCNVVGCNCNCFCNGNSTGDFCCTPGQGQTCGPGCYTGVYCAPFCNCNGGCNSGYSSYCSTCNATCYLQHCLQCHATADQPICSTCHATAYRYPW